MDHGQPRAAHGHAGAALTSEHSNSSFALAVGFTCGVRIRQISRRTKHALFFRAAFLVTSIAESLLLKHQLIISGRFRRRAPPLITVDRFVLGLMMLFVHPRRVVKVATIFKPATLLRFHKALVDRKYRRLFSSAGTRRKSVPKGQTEEMGAAVLEMKLGNPRFGNQRIAEQISYAFAVQIDKDAVRRVLAKRYGSNLPGASGPSWLTFFAQAKDSL